MNDSRFTAQLRAFVARSQLAAVYYVDVVDELEFIRTCDIKDIVALAREFCLVYGFDGYALDVVIGSPLPDAVLRQHYWYDYVERE